MEPMYMKENRYTHLIGYWKPAANADYEVKTPETEFEGRIQTLFLQGQAEMLRERFAAALDAFRELMALILRTANPKMPVDPNQITELVFPMDVALIDTLTVKAADILKNTPPPAYAFPPSMMSGKDILPPSVATGLGPTFESGLQVTSYHKIVGQELATAATAALKNDFEGAIAHYETALNSTPVTDTALRGSLLHDMAVLTEKLGDSNQARELALQSTELFAKAGVPVAQVQALDTFSGILRRAGDTGLADEQAAKATEIRNRYNLNPVISGTRLERINSELAAATTRPGIMGVSGGLRPEPAVINALPIGAFAGAVVAETAISTVDAPTLIGTKYIKSDETAKTLTLKGAMGSYSIVLDSSAADNVKGFLQAIRDTQDLRLVTDFWHTSTQMVAYLPHMYFFVIPMAMGDCWAGIGNLERAVEQYRSVLPYPYINAAYEVVKLWTRLAQAYLDTGDQLYRLAKDDTSAFGQARAAYENIVLGNKTLNTASPLYQDAKFTSIAARVRSFLAAPDPVAHNDNPAITWIVLAAYNKLQQIQPGLNFFGLSPDSPPPFSFEYMQNTARYFAQQASQIEQRYIQYMDQAENEEFRREQLDQQAEVAAQSVILEERGVAEARAGIAVAQASVDYAEVQRENAEQSSQDFNQVRWELLEYAELEAWANACVDTRKVKIPSEEGWKYYSTDEQRRDWVIQELAYRRTRISHDLEADKLQRAIDSAAAYRQVAQAQVGQAQARKAIAEQRVMIAQLQKKQAEENRDFLDMREFSARVWREMALQAKRLKQRYLDMATEIALLMERAYNAETERKLHVIRSDYSMTVANNLMGADQLLADIDSFTYDYVTTVRTKKIPVKQVISLADSHAMPFQQLKAAGRCFFQTELADFDRQHPGMYLCKLRNVEPIFVGLTNASSLAGSLRNVGVSRFRSESGAVLTRLYPSDVMALSQYELRQDALAFRFNPNELRLFENNGIDTLWQLDLPMHANDFDYREILDIQLVLYYDGFFSPSLEQTVLATLPTGGTASRAFSLGMSFFDELYYLKNKGEGELVFEGSLFPRNQKNVKRTVVTLKALGKSGTVANLALHLTSANHGSEIVLTTDAQGEVNQQTPGQPLNALANEPMLDTWTLRITAADNPALVNNGVLDLTGLDDILMFFEYSFDYR